MSDWRSEEEEKYIYAGRRMSVRVRLALVAFILIIIILLWFVFSPPESRGVIYVQAPSGVVRAVPSEPGGYRAEDKGMAVYRLLDKEPERPRDTSVGRKEIPAIKEPQREGRNYYSIHSDVVNIYTDEDRVVATEKKQTVPDTMVDLDLATFKTRAQATTLIRNLSKRDPYKSLLVGSRDKVVLMQTKVKGRTLYRVTIADMPLSEANQLCRSLKNSGEDCLVRR
ncbi:MAG: SPOR domain-containing protein [Alphaproteobacteria bacterium]|nr:SPOR domain-containing protein [Alphaproteobacteria bacterium]